MQISINFSLDEINQLLQILGQTPSSSGAFPFMVKLRQQTEQIIQNSKQFDSAAVPVAPPENFQLEKRTEMLKHLSQQITGQGIQQ